MNILDRICSVLAGLFPWGNLLMAWSIYYRSGDQEVCKKLYVLLGIELVIGAGVLFVDNEGSFFRFLIV